MRLTAAQIRQLQDRVNGAQPIPAPIGSRKLDLNKLETEFLQLLVDDPQNLDIWPHGIRLVLGENSRYEPDFLVMRTTGELVIYETKAEWSNGARGHDDSRGKVKAAASLFPFTIIIATKRTKRNGGGWSYETFPPIRRHIENRPAPTPDPAP